VARAATSKHFGLLSTLAITGLGALLRFANLSNPHVLVFDETYYVKDAYTLGLFGTERNWPKEPNPDFESGKVDGYLTTGAYVVHPPIGKWVIWLGLHLFGPVSSFGWRFSVALLGTLAIPLLIVIARRLIGSRLFAASAGLMLAIEGQSIVLSRTAILDGVIAFFVLLGFYFLVVDDQNFRKRLTAMVLSGIRPGLVFRPWLLLAGLSLGLATATKWSGLYFVAGFGLFTVLSEIISRRKLGIPVWQVLPQGFLNALTLVPIAITTYILSWWGWITTQDGWGRNATDSWVSSLWEYHLNALTFHTGLSTPHPYSSNALMWLANLRPTAFYFEKFSDSTCGLLSDCVVAITALPHPLIWLASVLAIFWLTVRFLKTRQVNAGLIVIGFVSGWAPWLLYLSRTTFSFYSVVFTPFLILALAYAFHEYWRRGFVQARVLQREKLLIVFFLLAMILLGYFASIWLGLPVPHWAWRMQMWLPIWI
jgi:dolichyl-phosphate-mannose-protein mannosyltransferase